MRKQLLLGTILLFILACREDEQPAPSYDPTAYQLEYAGFPEPPIAEDNLLTKAGVQLGRMLFYDRSLSRDGSQACADCHQQQFAFTDTSRFSLGVRGLPGNRQSMAVFNLAWHQNEFFWDGRAHLLRDQSLMPIQDPLEMDETIPRVIEKLNEKQLYRDQFVRAFGDSEITEARMSLALEQFMNSIVSTDSRYDRSLRDEITLTESEERGRILFFAEYNAFFPDDSGADCAHCHSGFNFTNNLYMNNGLDAESADPGRAEVTDLEQDRGKFKVTSLRNIALTAPYMHDGRFATLEEVVDHYNDGLHPSANLDPALEASRSTGLLLSDQDKVDLVQFLHTLTDSSLLVRAEYSNPF